MPMPKDGTAWPPVEWQEALTAMRRWDAWYAGVPVKLQNAYEYANLTRPSQYADGLVGGVSRFFWGKPIPVGQQRTQLHVPVPADLATCSADLLFSDPPRFLLPSAIEETAGRKNKAQDRLEALMNTPETHARLLEGAEVAAALSGVYMRVTWDKESLPDGPILTAVHADAAIPTFMWGRLQDVLFWTVVSETNNRTIVRRHLELHERGAITHMLYEGTQENIGRPIPLSEESATAWAVPLVDEDSKILTGVKGLTVAYVPNIRPNRRWRTVPLLTNLGRSDFDGIEPLFDALDETYSGWMRDIRLAKARLLVDPMMLQNRGPGQGAWFDADQEIFTQLNGIGPLKDSKVAQAEQFSIRHEEHRATADEILRNILRSAGYSPSTFGEDDEGGTQTATETSARERMSERTRDKKIRYWQAALGPLVRTLMEIDRKVYQGPGIGDELPEVRFPPNSQEDSEKLARTAQLLKAAEAASVETLVRLVHPDWEQGTVDDEVKKIGAQRQQEMPDPFTLRPGVLEDEETE